MEEDILYNKDIHHRRSIRLQNYDYSQNGLYFITICTQNREKLFWEDMDIKNVDKITTNVGANLRVRPPLTDNVNLNEIIKLNNAGKMINKWIIELPNKYKNIKIDEYVIMSDHIHLIMEIMNDENKENQKQSYLNEIIKWYKTMTTNEYIKMVKKGILFPFNGKIWQRNYYENIIRNEEEYLSKMEYIKNNPLKWINENL